MPVQWPGKQCNFVKELEEKQALSPRTQPVCLNQRNVPFCLHLHNPALKKRFPQRILESKCCRLSVKKSQN